MDKLMHRMKRKQTIGRLLLAFLLIAGSARYHNLIAVMVQAKDLDKSTETPDHSSWTAKLRTRGFKSQAAAGHALPTWETRREVEAMKAHKVPSGPSPIGNHHPPARP